MPERYQREIEEILQQVGESASGVEPKQAEKGSILTQIPHLVSRIGNLIYVSSGRLMTIGIVLLLTAMVVSIMFPGLLGPLVWLVLILFILVYALFFARPNPKTEKRWRGRAIEPPASTWGGNNLWYRFQRWLKR
ncbi:hypothetical protein FIM08_00585 [SAR202 cluster bacterium AC-647-N09_OGT_505m]|nr:hypothetical protein [SAR202 cluster bacterium AC-647-N09_OGT_505m]